MSGVDWNSVRRHARLDDPTPADWPRTVRAISFEGVQLLGLDDDNRLYWDGKEVVIRRTLDLSAWQKLGAVLIVVGTITGGVGALVQGGTATIDFGCARHVWHHWCTKP